MIQVWWFHCFLIHRNNYNCLHDSISMFILTCRACVLALTCRACVHARIHMWGIMIALTHTQGMCARTACRASRYCRACVLALRAGYRYTETEHIKWTSTEKSIDQNKCNSRLINNIKRKWTQHFPAKCIQSWRYNQDTILHPGVSAHMVDTVCWQQHMCMVS